MILPDIESYIEFIAGYRDSTGKQINWWVNEPVIQLASYDIGFVTSVAESTISHSVAMSHRQAQLAEKLIGTYAKQLKKLSIDQPDHKHYRLGHREVVHVNSLSLSGDMLFFRFTFNNKMISDIKAFAKESQGRVYWDKDEKAWVFAATEYNVSWAVAYAQSCRIPVAPEAQELFDLIVETEQNPELIELQLIDGKLVIQNAPDSLLEYVTENIGFDDIYALVDNAGVLAYSVSPEILEIIENLHGKAFTKLCSQRHIDIQEGIEDIIKWAKEVNRLPICVYNPNILNLNLDTFQQYFEEGDIQLIDLKNHTITVDPTKKLVYTNKIIPWEGRMPLLITYANLMQGATKRSFVNKAEKIVYYCPPLPRR